MKQRSEICITSGTMNKKGKLGKFTCKDCQKEAAILLKSKEEERAFREWKKGFSCPPCAFKFWDSRIKSGQTDLRLESPEFRQTYWEERKKFLSK